MGGHAQFTSVANYADAKLAQKFIIAVQTKDVKSLHKILKKEFDVNTLFRFESGMEKMSALHYSAKEGMLEVIKELLHHECAVDVLTPFDTATPLMFACQFFGSHSNIDIVTELLKHGADVNKMNHLGKTPLIFASELGCLELVRLLLNHGANINHTYKEDDLPETLCQALKCPTIQEYEVDEMCDAYRGNGALIQACREHHYPVVQELIKRGCDVGIVNSAGNTALHIACRSESVTVYTRHMSRAPISGNTRIVKCLLEIGCDVNKRNKHGETPLKRAICGISELIIWNIPLEQKIEEAKVFCDLIQILIHHGCDTDVDFDGMSALSLLLKEVCIMQNIDSSELQSKLAKCIKLLVSSGCPLLPNDIEFARKNLSEQTASMIDALFVVCPYPGSLKQLCKTIVRKCCLKPLGEYLPCLGLPPSLVHYVAFDMLDA